MVRRPPRHGPTRAAPITCSMHDEFFDDWLLAIAAYNWRVLRATRSERCAAGFRRLFQLAAVETRLRAEAHGMRRLVATPRTTASRSA